MLVDVSKLNKRKTYILIESGTGRTSNILKNLQHKKYPDIPLENVASHIACLIYRGNGWNVWENHMKWKGIKEYCIEDYEIEKAKDTPTKVTVHEYKLDKIAADYFRNNDPGYSVLDLGKISAKRLAGIKLPDSPGMVCSESAAHLGFKICNRLDIPAEYLAPVDWQYYFSL